MVGAIVECVLPSRGWLDKDRLFHFSVAFVDHDPSVNASAAVLIARLEVGFVVINRNSFHFFLVFILLLLLKYLVVKYRLMLWFYFNSEVFNRVVLDFSSHVHILIVFVNMGVFVVHLIIEMEIKGTIHQ